MNEYQTNKRGSASGGNDAATDASADLSSLFNYPSLGKLFEGQNADASLADMRTRLARTNQDLERVIRQGSKEDAERAAKVTRAFAITLAFLSELEELRNSGGGGATAAT